MQNEIDLLSKEIEEIYRKIIITHKDTEEIKKLRNEFKLESEKTMKEVYMEIKKRYMEAERDYLKNEHLSLDGKTQ